MKKRTRQSNFELLRIVALWFITSHHYYDKRKREFAEIMRPGFTATNVFFQYIYGLGNIGVNVFVMISGFFSCRSGYSARKILQLIIQQQFYAIGILLVLGISNVVPFTAISIYRHILSFVYNSDFWFGYAFVGLMLVGDYVNVVVQSLDKKTFKIGIFMIGLYYCVLQTINNSGGYYWGVDAIPWFVYIYAIGAYIRLHDEPFFDKKYRWLMLLILILVHSLTSLLTIAYTLWPDTPYSDFYKLNLDKRDRLTCLVSSTSLFILFKNVNVGTVGFINTISSTMFSLYLLQEGEQMRDVWWRMIFDVTRYYEPTWRMLLQYLLAISTIFVCGIIIDLLRQYLFEKPLFICIDWVVGKLGGWKGTGTGGEGNDDRKQGNKRGANGEVGKGSINDENTPLNADEKRLDMPLLYSAESKNSINQDQV